MKCSVNGRNGVLTLVMEWTHAFLVWFCLYIHMYGLVFVFVCCLMYIPHFHPWLILTGMYISIEFVFCVGMP